MSYRKIVVNGTEYQYSVGKTHTKIKGFQAVKNEEIGSIVTVGLKPCGCKECSCDPYEFTKVLRVKPSDISKFIVENSK